LKPYKKVKTKNQKRKTKIFLVFNNRGWMMQYDWETLSVGYFNSAIQVSTNKQCKKYDIITL